MASETEAGAGAQIKEESGKELGIQKIYLKDCSFEAPNTPAAFSGEWKPDVKLNVAMNNSPMGEDVVEVVLSITVEATNAEKTAFLCEVQQAGVFVMRGFGEDESKQLQATYIPGILFPYAREAISDLVGKGGFPQLMLQPLPFDRLFAQAVSDQQKSAQH